MGSGSMSGSRNYAGAERQQGRASGALPMQTEQHQGGEGEGRALRQLSHTIASLGTLREAEELLVAQRHMFR